jgi:hypothetical protein
MNNFQKSPANPSGTDLNPGDFPIGSPESRAAARAMIGPREIMIIVFMKPNGVYGGELCDSDHCTLGGKEYFRLPNESMDQFQDRVIDLQPSYADILLVMHPTEAAQPRQHDPE